MSSAKIRLCVDHPLGAGQSVPLTEPQAHYLFGVMREGPGSRVLLFNGRDGEWLAEVTEAGKRRGLLSCVAQTAEQSTGSDLWLLFAPVKKARTDFIVEKAVELGVARVVPIATDRTNAERLRRDKAMAHVREAAEQCGALHLPEVEEMAPLPKVLAEWDPARRILWGDEDQSGPASALGVLMSETPGPWAVLIGPEGGFSPAERDRLRALPFVRPVSLGPRILRAETAAVTALALWQAALGDWRVT
jgi:16S rRNA (uracil1498-N3)-methyltransferase